MKGYIIGIGGSGHRCIEAFIHLAAAGLGQCDEVSVMFVDSDSGNGNFDRTKSTLEEYMQVKSFIGASDGFFKSRIKLVGDIGKCLWSPLESPGCMGEQCSGNGTTSPDKEMILTDDQKNLNNIVEYNLLSEEEKILFDFLYTEKERNEALIEGFYGHPSIGSALVAKNLDFESEPWRTLINNIKNDVKNEEAKVFFVASIFGGTGASGFPTISRHLRKTIDSPGLKLGGILLLPYFRFDVSKTAEFDDSLCPDCGNFLAKSKAALFYYDNQKYYEIFDKIYMLGDSYDEFTEVSFSRGKSEQKNKPHIVELYSALAAADFFSHNSMSNNEKVCLVTRGRNDEGSSGGGKYIYDWNRLSGILPDKDEVKNKLARLLRFSIVYTKTYFPVINNIANSSSGSNTHKSATWYSNYFTKNNITIAGTRDEEYSNKLKPLNAYCSRFIDWIYEMHLQEASKNAPIDPRVCLFNVSYRNLFDKQYDTKYDLDNYEKLVFGHVRNANKAGEIYSSICKKRDFKDVKRSFVDSFILDLYDYSELK